MFTKEIKGRFATITLNTELLAGKQCEHGHEGYAYIEAVGASSARKDKCKECGNIIVVSTQIVGVK